MLKCCGSPLVMGRPEIVFNGLFKVVCDVINIECVDYEKIQYDLWY